MNNLFINYSYDKLKEFYCKYLISDERILRKRFKDRLNRALDLDNPVYFNDKLQWLKLYWRDPLATQCADKYEVRKYVEEKVGSKYLNDMITVYDSVDEINLKELPDSFVLKGTHGSGFNIICKDKNDMNWVKEFKKMRRWMWTNYYWSKREWVYKDIKPRIICERYLELETKGGSRDYRVFCFGGEPHLIAIDFDINNKSNARRNLYDLKWNLLEETITYERDISQKIEKPRQLDEMLAISRKLSKGFPHVRVDFYILDEKLYFSEMTFFHQSGMGIFSSEEFEIKLGNLIELPKQCN